MSKIDELTVTVNVELVNDAGITSEMVEALEEALDHASGSWRAMEREDLARDAIRRLWIATTGHAPDGSG